jgi:cell division protein FtsB
MKMERILIVLDEKLKEYEMRNEYLRKENEKLKAENDALKTRIEDLTF